MPVTLSSPSAVRYEDSVLGDLVDNHWQVLDCVGAGGFGTVYRGVSVRSGADVAIKMSWGWEQQAVLLNEFSALRNLAGTDRVPRVFYHGLHKGRAVMVLEYLGKSLEYLVRHYGRGRRLSLHTVFQLAINMLYSLEHIHDKGFLHRDIKPDNLLMGPRRHSKTCYIIDYGLAKRFLDKKTKKHIPFKDGKSVTGTSRYCSLNAHNGLELSRRDDILSMGYTIVYLLKGRLPWQGISIRNPCMKRKQVKKTKERTSLEELCSGLSSTLLYFFKHAEELHFKDRPNYSYLRSLFRDALSRRNLAEDGGFEWMDNRK